MNTLDTLTPEIASQPEDIYGFDPVLAVERAVQLMEHDMTCTLTGDDVAHVLSSKPIASEQTQMCVPNMFCPEQNLENEYRFLSTLITEKDESAYSKAYPEENSRVVRRKGRKSIVRRIENHRLGGGVIHMEKIIKDKSGTPEGTLIFRIEKEYSGPDDTDEVIMLRPSMNGAPSVVVTINGEGQDSGRGLLSSVIDGAERYADRKFNYESSRR